MNGFIQFIHLLPNFLIELREDDRGGVIVIGGRNTGMMEGSLRQGRLVEIRAVQE